MTSIFRCLLLHTNSHKNLSHFNANNELGSKVVKTMRDQRDPRVLSSKKQVHAKQIRKNLRRLRSFQKSGARKSVSQRTFTPSVDRLSPFSHFGHLLQTSHASFSNGEPFEKPTTTKTQPDIRSSPMRDFARRMVFQLVYLGDEDQSVEVEEVDEIDFAKLKSQLDEGKSVFITRKKSEKIELFPTIAKSKA